LGSATRASDYATTKDLEFPIAKYPLTYNKNTLLKGGRVGVNCVAGEGCYAAVADVATQEVCVLMR